LIAPFRLATIPIATIRNIEEILTAKDTLNKDVNTNRFLRIIPKEGK